MADAESAMAFLQISRLLTPSDVVIAKWISYGIIAGGIAVLANPQLVTTLLLYVESRSKPPSPLPEAKGHDHSVVCTEKSNPAVMMVKPAEDRV
jgi:hypothetical protein